MAIEVNEIAGSQTTGSVGQSNSRSYTRYFQVLVDSPNYDPRAILLMPGVPRRRSAYQSATGVDIYAICQDVRADRDPNSRLVWNVTAEYSNQNVSANNPQTHDNDDPTEDLPVLTWDNGLENRIVEKDNLNQPIMTRAGEPYEAIEYGFPKTKLTVDINLLVYNQDLAEQYVGAVNSDTWKNGAPRMWRCMGIKGVLTYKDVDYYKVQILFEKKKELWDLDLRHMGLRHKDAAGKLVAILDEQKREVQTPWPLSPTGRALSFADAIDPTQWNYLQFRISDELPFSSVFPF